MTRRANSFPPTSLATTRARRIGIFRGPTVRLACRAAALTLATLFFGCSANTVSLLFDGVPAPPPPKEYCAPYLASLQPKTNGNGSTNGTHTKPAGSVHPPYQEKRCDDCHDKTKGTGLLMPKEELCFKCHADITKGAYVHAAAASGACLFCHLPHDSSLPFLLKAKKAELCTSCHKEQRVSSQLHQKVAALSVACSDCHNPHAGNARYFFK